MKWHPDKNPNNIEETTRKIQAINVAYDTLKDPEKRKLYDQFGEDGLNIFSSNNYIGYGESKGDDNN